MDPRKNGGIKIFDICITNQCNETKKIKHKKLYKMIKFILKSGDQRVQSIELTRTLVKKETGAHFFCWIKFRFT